MRNLISTSGEEDITVSIAGGKPQLIPHSTEGTELWRGHERVIWRFNALLKGKHSCCRKLPLVQGQVALLSSVRMKSSWRCSCDTAAVGADHAISDTCLYGVSW